MRIATKRNLLRAAAALAMVCTAVVVLLPATAAEFSTTSRLTPAPACAIGVDLDCQPTAISLIRVR